MDNFKYIPLIYYLMVTKDYKKIAKKLVTKEGCIRVYKDAVKEDDRNLAISAAYIFADHYYDGGSINDELPGIEKLYESTLSDLLSSEELTCEKEFFGAVAMLLEIAEKTDICEKIDIKEIKKYLRDVFEDSLEKLKRLVENGNYYDALKIMDVPEAYVNHFGTSKDKKKWEEIKLEIFRSIGKK